MSESLIQHPLVADINSECSWGPKVSLRRPQPSASLVKSPVYSPDIPTIGSLERSAHPHFGLRRPEELRTSVRSSDRKLLRPPGIHRGVEADERVRPLRHSKEAPALTRYVSLQAVCRSVLRIRFFACRPPPIIEQAGGHFGFARAGERRRYASSRAYATGSPGPSSPDVPSAFPG